MKIIRRYIEMPDGRIIERDLPGAPPASPEVPPPEPAPVIYEPNPFELATNFARAMERVAVASLTGQRVKVTEEEYRAREAACNACELWDAKARRGLGKCKAPKCGCTLFKRYLATEVCRHPAGSRWPALGS